MTLLTPGGDLFFYSRILLLNVSCLPLCRLRVDARELGASPRDEKGQKMWLDLGDDSKPLSSNRPFLFVKVSFFLSPHPSISLWRHQKR